MYRNTYEEKYEGEEMGRMERSEYSTHKHNPHTMYLPSPPTHSPPPHTYPPSHTHTLPPHPPTHTHTYPLPHTHTHSPPPHTYPPPPPTHTHTHSLPHTHHTHQHMRSFPNSFQPQNTIAHVHNFSSFENFKKKRQFNCAHVHVSPRVK